MRCRWTIALATLLTLAGRVAAQDSARVRFTRVTYVSGTQVYVGAGRLDGLGESSEVVVIRSDTAVAALRVLYLSSHQAACVVLRGDAEIVPGDRVRYGIVAPADTARAPLAAVAPRPRPGGPGLHGRIGARALTTSAPGDGQLHQIALDARLHGAALGGTPLGVLVDVRTRSSRSSLAGRTMADDRTDVYQLALLWNAPGAPVRAVMGRQYLTSASSIVLLDGVLGELNRRHWSIGLFGGAEPAAGDLRFSAAVQDLGGYVQLRGSPHATRRWSVTTGAVGSYRAGATNREFAFVQALYASPVLSFNGAQEVDFYAGPRRAAEEHALSFTSTFVHATLRPSPRWSLDAGFDNRRSARLYEDVAHPITTFDDRYRQGVWSGVTVGARRVRARLEARTSAGGSAGRATAVTGAVGVDGIGRYRVDASARTTRYRSTELDGWLHAVRVGADPFVPLHLEFDGGVRRETVSPVSIGARRTTWLGAEADVGIGRAWYLVLSGTREDGPDSALQHAFLSLSYRF